MLGDERVAWKPCLTEAEFDDAVARSKTAYEAAMAVRAKEKAAHDALYDKAREKLPRVKAAYEEAVRKGPNGYKINTRCQRARKLRFPLDAKSDLTFL